MKYLSHHNQFWGEFHSPRIQRGVNHEVHIVNWNTRILEAKSAAPP